MKKIAKIVYKILKPYIEVEWQREIVDYGMVFRIKIFNKTVSEVIYSPDMGALRERWTLNEDQT